MEDSLKKSGIYKGMVQYILDSTNYTLKNIADLSNTSIENIRTIYFHDSAPSSLKLEVQLLKLYQIVLEINMNLKKYSLTG